MFGMPFGAPLVVQVTDAYGVPIPGVSVTFAAPDSGASAYGFASAVITDANGQASVSALANDTVGSYHVTASVAGAATSAVFSLTNGPAVPLSIVSGNYQATPINAVFGAPLVVQVTDISGNPLPGVSVSFATQDAAPSAFLSASTAITDANGKASVTATANG